MKRLLEKFPIQLFVLALIVMLPILVAQSVIYIMTLRDVKRVELEVIKLRQPILIEASPTASPTATLTPTKTPVRRVTITPVESEVN